MSTLSDFTITLNKSKDLIRCGLFLHALALIVLWNSRLDFIVMGLLSVALILSYWNTNRQAKQQWSSISRHHQAWILAKGHRQFAFNHLQIIFNGGFFLIIRCEAKDMSIKQVVIFLDQMTSDAYRLLVLSQKCRFGGKTK